MDSLVNITEELVVDNKPLRMPVSMAAKITYQMTKSQNHMCTLDLCIFHDHTVSIVDVQVHFQRVVVACTDQGEPVYLVVNQ